MSLETTTASNIVALILGLVGICIALVPLVREWRASRHARLIVTLEKLFRQDTGRLQERLRIENLGPARAEQVNIETVEEVDAADYGPAFEWHLPIKVLQPAQDHVLLIEPSIADKDPAWLVLSWRDRAGEHHAQFALSPKYL